MSLLKLLGVLVACYVVYALAHGEIYAKSGIWGRTYRRDDDATKFWTTVVVYSLLSIALVLLF